MSYFNDINEITLSGRLTADAEVVATQQGSEFVKVVLATNKHWLKDGEKHSHTEYNTVCFNNSDIKFASKLIKGDKIYVKGIIRNRNWKDNEGISHITTNIVAKELRIFDWKMNDGQYPSKTIKQ